ncbi:MAG: FMN-binding protein [Oscillospiraceae bacterium]|nr:FMN-binding protein [Oscillospiraceae bacterium]
MKEKIMPPLVLMLICSVCCALLVIAYELTYVDTTGMVTDKMKESLVEIYGTSDGFEMLKNEDGTVNSLDAAADKAKVDSVLRDANGRCAFEITASGYSKDGLYMLVGIDENGAVKGVSIMSIGETPGLGTKVQDDKFKGQFSGMAEPSAADTADNVTGASRSSKGMKGAIKLALETYAAKKEVIFGE